jgi:hypothetical protein
MSEIQKNLYLNNKPIVITLPQIKDGRGNLSIIEEFKQIPFKIMRTHWVYDVPGGVERGGHAFKKNIEFIVALSGSFDVVVDDGKEITTFPLNRSNYGLLIPFGLWRIMNNFSTNSLALILSSAEYDENDYILDYEEYRKWICEGKDDRI